MSGPWRRVGLVTLGLVLSVVGISIAIVAWLPSMDEALLGIPPGVPMALVGASLVVAGVLMGKVGWEMTPGLGEEE